MTVIPGLPSSVGIVSPSSGGAIVPGQPGRRTALNAAWSLVSCPSGTRTKIIETRCPQLSSAESMQAASIANPVASSVLVYAQFMVFDVSLGPIATITPEINLRNIADDSLAGNIGFWALNPDLVVAAAPFSLKWAYVPYNSVVQASSFKANTASGSPTLSTVTTFTGYPGVGVIDGAPIVGPGIPIGTTVLSHNVGASTITMSQNATATASAQQCYTGMEVGDGSGFYISLDLSLTGGATVRVQDYLVEASADNVYFPGTAQIGNTAGAGPIGAA